jgi:hypothetical protein
MQQVIKKLPMPARAPAWMLLTYWYAAAVGCGCNYVCTGACPLQEQGWRLNDGLGPVACNNLIDSG